MNKVLRLILFLLFIAQLTFAAQQPPNSVTIYLTAVSPKGKLFTFSAADISIQENKQQAQINRVDCGTPEPLLLAILVDISGSRSQDPNLSAHYDSLKIFLASTLGKGDTAYIVSFADQPRQLMPPTSDLTVLDAALDQLKSVVPKGKTALFDTLKMAANQNQGVDHVRRVMLTIGDFMDNSSKIDVNRASAAPLESSSTLFVLLDQNDRQPRPTTRTLEEGNPDDSFQVTRETGGQTFAIESKTQFPVALDYIHNILKYSCRVTYTPVSPADSKPLIRLAAKIVTSHATLFAPQARPARQSER